MRSLVAGAAGLLAVVVAIVTVPLLWISTHIADEDGYVELSSALAADDELQGAFVAYLIDEYVQRGLVPPALQDTATSALTLVTRTTADQPGFVEAWGQTQRDLHRSAFGDDDGPLTVSVRPLASFVTNRVGDVLPVRIEVPAELQAPLGTAEDRERLVWVERSQTWSLLGLMTVLLAAAVCLVAARSRPLALAGLGLGALVVAGVLRVATEMVSPAVVERTETLSPFAQAVQQLLVDRAATSLVQWLGWIAVAGTAALVLGGLGRLVAGRPA
jgi:hypothetical protein